MTYRILVLSLFIFLMPLSAFAGASNNQESKQEIKQIERAKSIDDQMGIQEIKTPEKPKKPKPSNGSNPVFQARPGFQQQPSVTVDRRN